MKRFFCFFLVFLIVLANISLLVRFNEEKVVNSDKELSREPYQEVVEGGDITELEEQIAALIAEITNLVEQKCELEAEISDLKSTNSIQEYEISILQQDIDALNEQIGRLESEKADLIERIEELEGVSISQTILAGAYTDATYTTRAYTWDELVARGDRSSNGGVPPEENEPAVEVSGNTITLWAMDYYIVVPDTVKTCFRTESGFKGVVLPVTTASFGESWESYGSGSIGTVYIKATKPPTLPSETFFEDCNYPDGYVWIVVPYGYGEIYKEAYGWRNYAAYITEGKMPI